MLSEMKEVDSEIRKSIFHKTHLYELIFWRNGDLNFRNLNKILNIEEKSKLRVEKSGISKVME